MGEDFEKVFIERKLDKTSDKKDLESVYEKFGELEFEKAPTNWVSLPDCTPFVRSYQFRLLSNYVKQYHNSVLDVGCGRGVQLMYWKAKGFSVVEGCDVSTAFGKGCVSRGTPFKRVDLNDEKLRLPYYDDAFDVVTCNHVLEHIKTPSIVVKEMVRVAKDIVLITVPAGQSYFSTSHIHFWNTLGELILGIGLLSDWVYSVEVTISKPEDVMNRARGFIVAIYKHLAGVPSFTDELLADDIREKVFEMQKEYDLYINT